MAVLDTVRKAIAEGDQDFLREGVRVLAQAVMEAEVIGPTGVWVVETKNYGGSLSVRGGDLWIASRRKTPFIDQGEAAAVSVALDGVTAIPVLCVHRADFPLLGRPELGGVRILGPSDLVKAIASAPVVLAPAEVGRLADLAERRLPPAS
jgi:hypothetical protein